jgi:acyl-CoA synthetase (AMP-forming)/AMP-acid ligase II
MARRGLLKPGRPDRIARQLAQLRRWGFGLAGEVRSAAARSPDTVALIDELTGRLTYRQLEDRVRRLIRALPVATGVRPGDRIGLLCRNHAGLVEAMVAATALGIDQPDTQQNSAYRAAPGLSDQTHHPRFAVPRDVYFVPALPRNATGKVVVRELFG